MKKRNDKYLLEAKKLWGTVNQSKVFNGQTTLQQYIENFKPFLNLYQAGNYYHLLFDIFNGEIIDVGAEVVEVLGYLPQAMNMQQFMDNIHPDDKAYFLGFEQKIVSFFSGLSIDEFPYYKVQYDFRIKTVSNTYSRILIQYLLVNYDEQNIYTSFHVHTDISHIKQEGVPCFSIIGIEERPSYYNIQIQDNALTKSFDLFTRREREILKEIIEGKSSKQIADKLFISLHTVNVHRKNIMEKAKVNTSLELVHKSVKEGWI